MLTTALIESTLARLPSLQIGVLGDLFLDRYLDLDTDLTEPSLETGLDAYQVVRVRSQPGAAGTIINNLVALGVGSILPLAIVGDDGEGYELRQALKSMPAVDSTHVISLPDRRTPTYTKPMLGRRGETGRELNRLDIKNRTPTPLAAQESVMQNLERVWPGIDALIVLDQVSEEGCGVVTARVRDRLAQLGASQPSRFILADSRERIRSFRNVCVKPNAREGKRIDEIRRNSGRTVFLTQGEAGIQVFRPGSADAVLIPAYPVTGPTDIVGAGDSVSAGITSAVAAGATPEQAAAFGNLIASITVQQIGTTGTATPDQVRGRWREINR
jgi:bifunctional ADP-heptose synthase (sugar kinase/adenylyltransferase)